MLVAPAGVLRHTVESDLFRRVSMAWYPTPSPRPGNMDSLCGNTIFDLRHSIVNVNVFHTRNVTRDYRDSNSPNKVVSKYADVIMKCGTFVFLYATRIRTEIVSACFDANFVCKRKEFQH